MTYAVTNVTKLRLIIDRTSHTDSIKHISTIVDLSIIEKLQLHFGFFYEYNADIDSGIESLLKLTSRLRSFELLRNFSDNTNKVPFDIVISKLPHHVKHLTVSIDSEGDAIAILERVNDLSSITFQGNKVKQFEPYITEWLAQNYVDYTLQVQPFSRGLDSWELQSPSLHIWFGQRTNEQSQNISRRKRLKLTHATDCS